MALCLHDLDAATRLYMLDELDADLASGTLYRSPLLSDAGASHYPVILRASLADGTEETLAQALGAIKAIQPPARLPQLHGEDVESATQAVSSTLAEREFHRFYLRGLCCRAIAEGIDSLAIYRARPADGGRASTDAMVGVRIAVRSLLEDLRGTFRIMPPHGLPQCRDPGLSLRLPEPHTP
ncbi:MAG: hypothetical protein IT306_30425 [Chloroflexi bacterium]|nr:hypothetical protein [Chloroflexota bacterium]